MTKSDDYLWDKTGEADPEVARLEALLSPLAHRAPLDEIRIRRRSKLPWISAGVAVLAAAAVLLIVFRDRPEPRPRPPETLACSAQATGFAFSASGGTVACGGASVPAGVLPIGGTLDTGLHEVELAIADIGSARLSAGTRIRLDGTSADRHQLYLEAGRMHAVVSAPPRIFAVATPSGQVTDLGCEYTLEVDQRGAGQVEVQSGMVELASSAGVVIVVPAGARARLLSQRRASLPLAKTAAPDLTAAVSDFEAGGSGIDRILATAKVSDAITVANLARLVSPDQQRAVLDRLMELVPAPQDMSVDDVIELDLFDMWFDEIVFQQIARNL